MAVPFVPFANVAKLDACFTQAGQKTMNTHYFRHIGGAMDAEAMNALAESYKNYWTETWQAQTPSTTALRLIRVTDLTTETSTGIEYSAGLPLAGSRVGGVAVPNNVTYAVKWLTGFRGRSYRGRTYGTNLAEADRAGNYLGTDIASLFQGKWATLIDLVPLDWEMGIASRIANGSYRVAGVFTPITTCTVNDVLDSQRRRLPDRGE